MAEFIFDLQRFPDDDTTDTTDTTETIDDVGGNGNGEGSSSGSEGGDNDNSSGDSDTSGGDTGNNSGEKISSLYGFVNFKNFNSNPGWETRIRNKGEIIFPMFMDIATADAFSGYAYGVFTDAIADGTVSYYNMEDSIAGSFDFSRLLSGSTILDNDTYDTINLIDTNVGNVIEYYTYSSGDMLSLVFDTGAILAFDIGQVSPWFNFANSESMIYSKRVGQWISGQEAEAEFVFWNTATITDADANGNYAVSQTSNNAIVGAGDDNNVLLYDATSADVLGAATVSDSDITIYFPTGASLVVKYDSVYSPNFYLADGASYYYNNDLDEWREVVQKASDTDEYIARTALENAAEKAAYEATFYEAGYNVVVEADAVEYSTFPLSIVNNNYIYYTPYYDTIYFADAFSANVVDMSAEGDYLNFTFSNGTITTIEYNYNFSPIIAFADGDAVAYNYRTETWGTPYYATDNADTFALSRGANSLVYNAGSEDTIYFADAVAGNITNISAYGSYIDLYFDTGAVVNVRYTDGDSPGFIFADGSEYVYDSYSGDWFSSSADTASDGLWGDTFSGTAQADGIFVGTYGNTLVQNVDAQDTITFDAALSDIVATSVADNTIAIAFNTGVTAVIETSGDSPTFNLASGESYIYDRQAASWKQA